MNSNSVQALVLLKKILSLSNPQTVEVPEGPALHILCFILIHKIFLTCLVVSAFINFNLPNFQQQKNQN